MLLTYYVLSVIRIVVYIQLLDVYYMKTCNLFTVKNTPSEARRNTLCVDYYFIDFCHNEDGDNDGGVTSVSLSRLVNVIYGYLDDQDLYIEKMYICARMTDNSIRRIFKVSIDTLERHMRLSRVR